MHQSMISEVFIGRRGRLRTYVFEFATALAYPLVGLIYLFTPELTAAHSPVGQRVYPFDYIWSIAYVVGGLIVLAGIMWARPRWRVVGLILLGTALSMQVTAAVLTHWEPRELFNAIYAVACFTRASLVATVFRNMTRP